MEKNDALESAITKIQERLKKYKIQENELSKIEKVIEIHRSRQEFYESSDWAVQAKIMHEYIQLSTREIERRMELNERELWTPFTI